MSQRNSTGQTESASTARSISSVDQSSVHSPNAPQSLTPEPSAFLGAALGMSWQLAVVVLIPVVGGFKLDEQTGRLPLFTMLGFVVAMIASVLVVKRALSEMSKLSSRDTTAPNAPLSIISESKDIDHV